MKFASVRVVAREFDRLVGFYAKLTGIEPTHLAPGFAEIRLSGCTLAISAEALIQKLNGGAIVPEANRSLMLEFEVDDVEAVEAGAREAGTPIVQPPTTMPWDNRSMLLCDPDGAVINIFSRPKP
jgi:predicted enzyme related to lactoylglutathione lyase